MLLASSVVALAVVKIGLVPEKISALGIDLTVNNQVGFLIVIGFIVAYFLFAFVIYGASDFIAWRVETTSFKLERVNKAEKIVQKLKEDRAKGIIEDEQAEKTAADKVIEGLQTKIFSRLELWRKLVIPTVVVRALFEFLLPIGVAIYALYSLAIYACHIGGT